MSGRRRSYLSGAPSLPSELLLALVRDESQGDGRVPLSRARRQQLARELPAICAAIRRRRAAHEALHGPVFVEPPALLDPLLFSVPPIAQDGRSGPARVCASPSASVSPVQN